MNMRFAPPIRTIAELLHHLGDIPAERVRFDPVPGTATIDDLLKPENDRCELVDGTLVEKAVGYEESFLSMFLAEKINNFVRINNLGALSGEKGFFELPDGPVRAPDLAFVAWDRMADRRRPRESFPHLAPDLAVDILSPSNSIREMARKRGEYFRSRVCLVWEIDPRARTVRVYNAVDQYRDLTPMDTLDGGEVLPGFSLPLAELFAELDRHG